MFPSLEVPFWAYLLRTIIKIDQLQRSSMGTGSKVCAHAFTIAPFLSRQVCLNKYFASTSCSEITAPLVRTAFYSNPVRFYGYESHKPSLDQTRGRLLFRHRLRCVLFRLYVPRVRSTGVLERCFDFLPYFSPSLIINKLFCLLLTEPRAHPISTLMDTRRPVPNEVFGFAQLRVLSCSFSFPSISLPHCDVWCPC